MREFFHGWRRKTGCVTLVMACAAMGMWIRSRVVGDSLTIPANHSVIGLSSLRERVIWQRLWYSDGIDLAAQKTFRHHSWKLTSPESDPREIDYDWHIEFLGFNFYSGTIKPDSLSSHLWSIPYGAITIPLTMLSAYLILWKPGRKEQPHA